MKNNNIDRIDALKIDCEGNELKVINGIDDDGDWVEKDHDTNDNGEPDVGEVNVDEEDEGRMQRKDISLFPVIPTIGITIYF